MVLSRRVQLFPESVIREMTRVALEVGAINLGQGFPDFDPPKGLVEEAQKALSGPYHQYSLTWGAPVLREAVARSMRRFWGISCDPDRHVTVTCGSTEAMMASLLSLVEEGDEVVVFEPFYENYGPDSLLCGARLRTVPLDPSRNFRFDEEELKEAFTSRTKVVIVNTPNNPCGRVFTQRELELIRDLLVDHDAYAVTDEIYEHIVYDGRRHIPLASLPGAFERTVTIQGASKTYSVTGWRVAWAVAPEELTGGIRRAHDFLTVGAPHPLQVAVAWALGLPDSYYEDLRRRYEEARRFLGRALEEVGFRIVYPEGAYYFLADFRDLPFPSSWKVDDRTFAEHLALEARVVGIPGSSFFSRKELGSTLLRFHFAKRIETLKEASDRLRSALEKFR